MLNTDFFSLFKRLLTTESKYDLLIRDILTLPAYKELFRREYCMNSSRMKCLFDLCLGNKRTYLQTIQSHYKEKLRIEYRFYEYILSSIKTLKERINDVEDYLTRIDKEELENDVKQRLSDFIDADLSETFPEVHFIVSPGHFGYTPVIMDLSFIVDRQTGEMLEYSNLVNTIAHECFHVVRRCEMEKRGLVKSDFLYWLSDQILNEGIADCIDILPRYDQDSEFIRQHKENQKKQPDILKKLRDVLKKTNDGTLTKEQKAAIRKLVPDAGHALGFYILGKQLENGKVKIQDIVYNTDWIRGCLS